MIRRSSSSPLPRVARGFTLIEAALTTMIVGVAFVAIMQLFAACTQQNRIGQNMTTAMLLAGHIQETMAGLSFNDPAFATTYFGPEPGQTLASYDDIDDFDGTMFSPPIDARRQPIVGQVQFTQAVDVSPVYAMQPSSNSDLANPTIPKSIYTGCVRVTVRILYRANPTDAAVEVYRTSWLRVDN
jgi:type II secretory pathway pseudopilin PulG